MLLQRRDIKFKDVVSDELRARLVRREDVPKTAAAKPPASAAAGAGASNRVFLPAPGAAEPPPAQVRALNPDHKCTEPSCLRHFSNELDQKTLLRHPYRSDLV